MTALFVITALYVRCEKSVKSSRLLERNEGNIVRTVVMGQEKSVREGELEGGAENVRERMLMKKE